MPEIYGPPEPLKPLDEIDIGPDPDAARLARQIPYVQFVPETGEIVQHGITTVEVFEHLADAGKPVVDAYGTPDGNYVEDGKVQMKAPCPGTLAMTDTGCTISGLPMPCTVRIDDAPAHEVVDGVAEIGFNHPGQYVVEVASVRFLNRSWGVTYGEDPA